MIDICDPRSNFNLFHNGAPKTGTADRWWMRRQDQAKKQ